MEKKEEKKRENLDFGQSSYTMGIISIVLGFVSPVAGLIIGIIGLVLGNRQSNEFSKRGKKLSKIGIVVSIIVFALTMWIIRNGLLSGQLPI